VLRLSALTNLTFDHLCNVTVQVHISMPAYLAVSRDKSFHFDDAGDRFAGMMRTYCVTNRKSSSVGSASGIWSRFFSFLHSTHANLTVYMQLRFYSRPYTRLVRSRAAAASTASLHFRAHKATWTLADPIQIAGTVTTVAMIGAFSLVNVMC
jgi:hypothetical protein